MGAPIKNTCPDIDRAIKHLREALSEIQYHVEDKKEFRNIEWEIDAAIGYFEDLRSANDALRKWGDGLEDELQAAADEISRLEELIPQ